MSRQIKYKLVALGLSSVLAFAAFELALFAVASLNPSGGVLRGASVWLNQISECGVTTFEAKFARTYETNRYIIEYHEPHATRGWIPAPSQRIDKSGINLTINAQRARAMRDYDYVPDDRFKIFIVGDSYTFGWSADDEFVWPNLLQQMNPTAFVFNFAVAGYGLGQMLITLEEEIETYKPDLVILAYITDDIRRAILPFRSYMKPYFAVENDKLVRKNGVVDLDIDKIYNEIVERKYSFCPYTLAIAEKALKKLKRHLTVQNDKALINLGLKIVGRAHDLAAANNAKFALVYLTRSTEIESGSLGERFLNAAKQRLNLDIVNTRPFFVAEQHAGAEIEEGHYVGLGAVIAARSVDAFLRHTNLMKQVVGREQRGDR